MGRRKYIFFLSPWSSPWHGSWRRGCRHGVHASMAACLHACLFLAGTLEEQLASFTCHNHNTHPGWSVHACIDPPIFQCTIWVKTGYLAAEARIYGICMSCVCTVHTCPRSNRIRDTHSGIRGGTCICMHVTGSGWSCARVSDSVESLGVGGGTHAGRGTLTPIDDRSLFRGPSCTLAINDPYECTRALPWALYIRPQRSAGELTWRSRSQGDRNDY